MKINKQREAESNQIGSYTPERQNFPSEVESESSALIDNKKSPIKYRYLSKKSKEQQRQLRIFWLQCFSMFIFIYCSTCAKVHTGIDLQFFVGLMMAIPICAKQTGANLNPSISYSMTFKADFNILTYHSLLWLYIKAQLIGAVLAMVCAIGLNNVYWQPVYPHNNIEGPFIHNEAIVRVIMSEALGVFILVFFILYGTGSYSFITHNGARYFYIATFVYIGRRFAITSANQINLALTFSQAFVGLYTCDFRGFKFIAAWIIGDILGVLLAASFYTKLVQPTLDYLEKHKTAKVMSKLDQENSSQMKNINAKSQIHKQRKQMQANEILGDQGTELYSKKLQYF